MAELIVVLSNDVTRHLKKGGYFISSGILREKAEMVKEALAEAGFTLEKEMYEGDWCALGARYE